MKFLDIVNLGRRWLSATPERALDAAYRAAIKIKAIEDNMDMLSSQENFGINESETLKELEKLKSRLEALEEKISLKQEYETAADEQVLLLTTNRSVRG